MVQLDHSLCNYCELQCIDSSIHALFKPGAYQQQHTYFQYLMVHKIHNPHFSKHSMQGKIGNYDSSFYLKIVGNSLNLSRLKFLLKKLIWR